MAVIEGIHRVALCVQDLERTKKAFEEAFGCDFFDPGVFEPMQVHSVTDVDKGLVLTMPTSYDSPIADNLRRHGQHCMMICFRVSDIEEAKRMCHEKGINILQEIKLGDVERYKDAAELVLDPASFPEWGGNFMLFYGREESG
ncbi:MAG: VOC family protein [Proteobacteria bacterium]|nr:VOC family protein [Pseudomonadota bacterium]